MDAVGQLVERHERVDVGLGQGLHVAALAIGREHHVARHGTVPEHPVDRTLRFESELGLSDYLAEVLVRDKEIADLFEAAHAIYPKPKPLANWIVNSLREELNSRDATVAELGMSPERFVDLVKSVEEGVVNTQKARDLFDKGLAEADDDPTPPDHPFRWD